MEGVPTMPQFIRFKRLKSIRTKFKPLRRLLAQLEFLALFGFVFFLASPSGCEEGFRPKIAEMAFDVPMKNGVNIEFPSMEYVEDPAIKATFGICQGLADLGATMHIELIPETTIGWIEYSNQGVTAERQEQVGIFCLGEAGNRREILYLFVGFLLEDLVAGNEVQIVDNESNMASGLAKGALLWFRATEDLIYSMKFYQAINGTVAISSADATPDGQSSGNMNMTLREIPKSEWNR
jgi:hypothetical protein